MSTENVLKIVALALVLGIVGTILGLIVLWVGAIVQVGTWVMVLAAGGGAGG